jgi:hypothetical protein
MSVKTVMDNLRDLQVRQPSSPQHAPQPRKIVKPEEGGEWDEYFSTSMTYLITLKDSRYVVEGLLAIKKSFTVHSD